MLGTMLLLLVFLLGSAKCDEYERKLYEAFMGGYNTLERPVHNNSHSLQVSLGVKLQQLIDVDEKNQIILTYVWLNYSWHDYNFVWDPDKNGGVKDLRFPANKIWKPDVLLFNSVDSNFDPTYQSNIVARYNGEMTWIPPGILRSSCTINIRWFPFDDQQCYLKFGSWTHTKELIQLKQRDMDISTYMENGEWILMATPVEYLEKPFLGKDYVELNFHLHLRRRTVYYGFNMLIPSIQIALMTLLGFALPVESGEKVTCEITIMLSICVFMNMISSMTPTTSEAVPLIGMFFSCNMLLVSLSVVFSVLVLNLHYRTPDTHQMSPLMRKMFLYWVPWALGMKRPGHKLTRQTVKEIFKESKHLFEKKPSVEDEVEYDKEAMLLQYQQSLNHFGKNDACDGDMHFLRMLQIYMEVTFVTQRIKSEQDENDAKNDWKFVATVVDRLCFWVFMACIAGSTCGIIFSAPHLVV